MSWLSNRLHRWLGCTGDKIGETELGNSVYQCTHPGCEQFWLAVLGSQENDKVGLPEVLQLVSNWEDDVFVKADGTWYFWDEAWAENGPFDNRHQALCAVMDYCQPSYRSVPRH